MRAIMLRRPLFEGVWIISHRRHSTLWDAPVEHSFLTNSLDHPVTPLVSVASGLPPHIGFWSHSDRHNQWYPTEAPIPHTAFLSRSDREHTNRIRRRLNSFMPLSCHTAIATWHSYPTVAPIRAFQPVQRRGKPLAFART
ncbi:hypothetical protein PUNSTDRAFT_120107 [Punctularia strigosozonata HHB-11173 SS5]|uniref:uncharacterized protein n=1 Tax=Punctularia strigosozonata (strain HHB-11173) TaxID=741275 RepID=UPI00044175E6|nr:uncharacterized protein PUNSTDRAFT_120107 [Punctularia strigosozonata HHB-11173 SS5]EIN09742.1 hypothetical protein PUNSTDRAFT_120107 [Punctularia strigosozonata HHB-11173 SS5]